MEINKHTKNKGNIFNLTVQDLGTGIKGTGRKSY